jgi:hypothetical protein
MPRQIAGDWRTVTLDITVRVTGPGRYRVALGDDAPVPVDVKGVRILRDGTPAVSIQRETSTRSDFSQRTYELEMRPQPPGGSYALELTIRCTGPQAGFASVWMERSD